MEAILFSTVFTGGIVGLYRSVLYLYHRKIKENQALISITKLDADLWKVFSKYIRRKDADWKEEVACYTCGKRYHWKMMDAGHYIAKSTTNSFLKFYEKNVHPQCQLCNRVLSSNHKNYTNNLIIEYGQGVIDELDELKKAPALDIFDYQNKIKFYSQWLKSH